MMNPVVQQPEASQPSQVEVDDHPSLVDHLQDLLLKYLDRHPYASLSSIGRKSGVSEPTLRRLKSGNIKTTPTTSTVIKFLTYVSSETSLKKIADLHGGAIAEFLRTNVPQIEECEIEFDAELSDQLSDNTKYLIYKLAANSSGTDRAQIESILGKAGLMVLEEMIERGLIVRDGIRYRSHLKTFALDPKLFRDKFRYMSHFIQSNNVVDPDTLPTVHANYSNSVNPSAYRRICKIQKNALAKIREVMESPASQGEIPLFCLSAIDKVDEN